MIISKTPMRISFSGGGTDIGTYYRSEPNQYGAVVSAAISWYVYITVNKKFDHRLRVSYSQNEVVDHVDQLEHNIIREALKLVGIEGGIEVVCMSDIPMVSTGSGLGSSSSLAVGVLKALYAYVGKHVSAERIAREACQIEIDILKHPIGKQDQYAAAYGGINYIQFNADESVCVEPLCLPKDTRRNIASNILLFNTNINRISSDVLTGQKKKINKKFDFYHELLQLSKKAKHILTTGQIDNVGSLLGEGWDIKKRLADNISNDYINQQYEKAMAAGADGGKISGAGGGGFLMVYCKDEEKRKHIRQALSDMECYQVDFETQGSQIIYFGD